MKYIAFLRGINVGGSGILKMAELKELCEKLGFSSVQTFIQSGNVIFESSLSEAGVLEKLSIALEKKMGKPIITCIRTPRELAEVLKKIPFSKEEPAKVAIVFFTQSVKNDFLSKVSTSTGETVKLGKREAYIFYANGMGKSKLKLPKEALQGTMRNLNTVQKIIKLCD
jgi:uncharacterized protein (DUF1697 family)